jgi:DNA-binding LacI/PurR family transcriptional regulator
MGGITGEERVIARTTGQDLMRGLELESARRDLIVETIHYGYGSGDLLPDRDPERVLARIPRVVGFVLLTLGLNRHTLRAICAHLTATSLPVAVIDDTGVINKAFPRGVPRRYAVFDTGHGSRAAVAVAARLHAAGHRSVAYVSPFHDLAWSQERLAGLRSVFSSVPGPLRVETLLGANTRKPGQLPGVRRWLSEVTSGLQFPQMPGAPHMAQTLSDTLAGQHPSTFVSLMQRREAHLRIEALMEKLPMDGSITAIVGANDNVALAVMRWLHRRGVSVPEQISVVGFDDTIEAYSQQLTSYNFNTQTTLRRAIDYVISPSTVLPHVRRRHVRIDGFLSVRRSLGAGD